jgi:excisionase family DNA binding protein
MADKLEVNTDQGEWLSLGKAATLLGVHSMTLRRWSDNGRFPSYRTPGGHRRFARKDIDYHLSQQQANVEGLPENWAESALVQTRQEVAHHQSHPWMQTVIEHDLRNEYKQLGHQLMGLLLQYVAAEEPNDSFLKEAQRIGRKYGAYGRRAGLTLTSILEATLFFRDILVESSLKIPSTTYVESDASLLILRRVNQIVNTVQLSVSDYYEKTAR